jgi:hypothetical protein
MLFPKGATSPRNCEWSTLLDTIKSRLDELERKTPIVPDGVHRRVENTDFAEFEFEGSAKNLRRAKQPAIQEADPGSLSEDGGA